MIKLQISLGTEGHRTVGRKRVDVLDSFWNIFKKWIKFGNMYAVPSNSMHAKAVLNSDLSRMRGAAVCTNLSVTTVKKFRLAEFRGE